MYMTKGIPSRTKTIAIIFFGQSDGFCIRRSDSRQLFVGVHCQEFAQFDQFRDRLGVTSRVKCPRTKLIVGLKIELRLAIKSSHALASPTIFYSL